MYQSVLQVDGCAVEYDDRRHVMRVTMHGLLLSDTYRQVNLQIAEFARRQPLIAIISNLRGSGMVSQDDQSWVAEHILPLLVDRGLHFTAFVLPANHYAELSLKSFSQHVSQAGPVYQRYFATMGDAEKWVDAVLQPA